MTRVSLSPVRRPTTPTATQSTPADHRTNHGQPHAGIHPTRTTSAVSHPATVSAVPEADVAPLKNKTRVRVTEELRGVPEGTAGTVKGTVGLAFPRHRVVFDNGRLVTSVARMNLVLEDEWDAYQADQAAKAEAAAAKAVEAPAEPAEAPAEDAGGGASPADDRMAALLARSKAAREKKAAAG
jgi:hypothetical protein